MYKAMTTAAGQQEQIQHDDMMGVCADEIPESRDFFLGVDSATLVLIMTAVFLTVCICVIFVFHLVAIFSYVRCSSRAAKLAWLAAIFPVTASVCIVGLCIPRAMRLVDTVAIMYFARCLLGFIDLIVDDYFGGRREMMTAVREERVHITTFPVCCICRCLPTLTPTSRLLRRLQLMVYQAAFVRPLIVFTYGCFWSNRNGNIRPGLRSSTTFLTVVNVASTMTCMWALNIMMVLFSRPLHKYRVTVQFRLICIILLLFNLQGNIFSVVSSTLAPLNIVQCDWLLSATARADVIHHLLLVLEMLLLSILTTIFLRPSVNQAFDYHPNAMGKLTEEQPERAYAPSSLEA